MKPIMFACQRLIPKSTSVIFAEVADTNRWSEFNGYGLLPGIASASYAVRTENMVGSRIQVLNRDGSRHVEEITAWIPDREIAMTMQEFSPPLSLLATHFIEAWYFQVEDERTRVTRTFQMFPRHVIWRPALWLISLLFRRAIARHLAEMAGEQP
jgi:hypothetical protein